MATTHKKLGSGQLGTGAGDMYAPTVYGMVKTILLHNTGSGEQVVDIYFGTASASADKVLRVTLEGYETFEWTLQHMLVVDGTGSSGVKVTGETSDATTLNYFIFGAEEL